MNNYAITVENGVGIINAANLKDASYKIFPNPISNNQLNLEIWNNDAVNCNVQLFNMQGKEVFNQQFDLDFGLNKNKINTEQLAKGIYLVKVNHGNSQFEQKIIIE
jgi:Secretion system C-terminal sorting domain